MGLSKQRGFTLVELSIVLVIIGLIVSGVLVGQDLITAARISATVHQVEKHGAGAGTFQAKYGGARPGDITCTKADIFGLTGGLVGALCGSGNNVGDGDGVLEGFGGGFGAPQSNLWSLDSEMPDFWNHLSEAAFIPGVAPDTLPVTKLGKGVWIAGSAGIPVGAAPAAVPGSKTYYYIIAATPLSGIPAIPTIITPIEAFGMDNKMDDGLPTSGKTRAIDAGTMDTPILVPVATPPTGCVTGAGPIQYNVSIENNVCSIMVAASS